MLKSRLLYNYINAKKQKIKKVMEIKPNINKLRGLRVENQLNQSEMAILMDSSLSSYQRIESGEKNILLEEAYKASKIFGKTIEEIFFTY